MMGGIITNEFLEDDEEEGSLPTDDNKENGLRTH